MSVVDFPSSEAITRATLFRTAEEYVDGSPYAYFEVVNWELLETGNIMIETKEGSTLVLNLEGYFAVEFTEDI
jgi:hypothetical protein